MLLGGCSQPPTVEEEDPPIATAPLPVEPPEDEFAASVAEAHNFETFHSKDALQADVTLKAGEEERFSGSMLVKTGSGRARFELDNGVTLVWDGSNAWVSPADAEFPRARFHVRTWPYFLMAPMKLGDPGVELEPLPRLTPWARPPQLPR